MQPVATSASYSHRRPAGSRPKGHQNVLVFVKGDPVEARKELGNVEPCSAISAG